MIGDMSRFLQGFDAHMAKLMFNRPKRLQPFMIIVSRLGVPLVVTFVTCLLALTAYIYGESSIALGFLLCIVALIGGGVLKTILKRERPTSLYVDSMRIKSFSFPSGHALGTLVLYGYIIALLFYFVPWLAATAALVGLGSLVVLTGVSRVYLGAHHASDVLGGWLLGAIALVLIVWVTFS